MATTYNGNAGNAAAQIAANQVQITIPQDGDAFTASEDNSRTNNLADVAQAILQPFATAYTWLKAQTFALLATFSAGITSSAGPNTFGANTTIGAPTRLVVGGTGVAFLNSWVAPTNGDPTVSYFKDAMGFVGIEGAAKGNGASSGIIFQFPAGYRPTNGIFRIPMDDATATAAHTNGTITIDTSGNVTFIPASGGSFAQSVSLSDIRFATF
jgi:hypothetical protein